MGSSLAFCHKKQDLILIYLCACLIQGGEMNEERKVEIWQSVSESDVKAALPTFGRSRVQVTQVDAPDLAKNLKNLLANFQELLDEQPQTSTGYHIEEIELSLGVNGKGGFALIGMVEAGVQASVKVKLKKTSS
jgi:hypothetical protein